MKLIATKQGKSDKYDTLRCVRLDGTETSVQMPRQGILPHDLIHYVVEHTLGYQNGFLGTVAQGAEIGFAMQQSHDTQRADLAAQLIHAEAIVESLQAQLWSGSFDAGMFASGLQGACASRGQTVPDLSAVDVREQLFARTLALGQRWQQLPFYSTLELQMDGVEDRAD
jgi:hypothetical protein